MPYEPDPSSIPEPEQQLEAAESGHYGHAQQRAIAPDEQTDKNSPAAASHAAEGGNIPDNYTAERRQLDADPPLPPQPTP